MLEIRLQPWQGSGNGRRDIRDLISGPRRPYDNDRHDTTQYWKSGSNHDRDPASDAQILRIRYCRPRTTLWQWSGYTRNAAPDDTMLKIHTFQDKYPDLVDPVTWIRIRKMTLVDTAAETVSRCVEREETPPSVHQLLDPQGAHRNSGAGCKTVCINVNIWIITELHNGFCSISYSLNTSLRFFLFNFFK